MSPSLSTHPLIPRKTPALSLSTTTKQKAHEVGWSCAFAEYGQLRSAGGETRTHKWGFTHRRFLRPLSLPISAHPQKSVRCYGISCFDTDLRPIVGDPSSTNGPTARSENSRCSPSTQRLSAVSEKCYVQDLNLILSTEGATHSCEHLHHLTDGHSKMIVYLY